MRQTQYELLLLLTDARLIQSTHVQSNSCSCTQDPQMCTEILRVQNKLRAHLIDGVSLSSAHLSGRCLKVFARPFHC